MEVKLRVDMKKDLSILIFDASAGLRKKQIAILKEMGFRGKVYEVGTAESAKKLVLEQNIEFVVMSWDSQDVSIKEFLNFIRESKEYENVPVMLLTSEGDITVMIEAIKAGASSYIIKPINAIEYIKSFQLAYEKHYCDII